MRTHEGVSRLLSMREQIHARLYRISRYTPSLGRSKKGNNHSPGPPYSDKGVTDKSLM